MKSFKKRVYKNIIFLKLKRNIDKKPHGLSQGALTEGGGLCTADLQIKVACFASKVKALLLNK